MQPVPERLARTVHELYGAAGAAWLGQLPGLIAECEGRWSLTVFLPFPNLSYNYVAPAKRSDGSSAVLKLGVPDRELLTQIAALRFCDGQGMVKLLEADAEKGAMLLERLEPGTPLSCLEDDEKATSIAAQVMRTLWRPAPDEHPFPTVADWAQGLQRLRQEFQGGRGSFPAWLVERAEGLFAELLSSQAQPVLLHGDLHHDNILSAERRPWLALDPKGVVGEPAYETGALLRNPGLRVLHAAQPRRMMRRRLDLLAGELELDRQRLAGWGLAQAVLSAWWSYEDHGHGWESALAYAEILSTCL